jgi:transaldolase
VKFFIDTADIAEIREAQALGILDGVTTNPTLIAKTGRPFKQVIHEICEIVPGPVSAEAVAETAEDFIAQGQELAKIAPNVVVKLPLNTAGLKACRALSNDNIKTNVTLVFQPIQALMAAKAGATFVSPFIGRLDDIGTDGMNLISDIVTIFDNYSFDTEILTASIRHPVHVLQAAMAGAHVATIPMSVFDKLVSHPLTHSGIERFNQDYLKIPQS